MHTAKIQITPKLATEWLKQNTNNIRAILPSKVDLYAGMMSRDKWTLTHQGIAFDELDNLIDGQHRLKAIVKSTKTINSEFKRQILLTSLSETFLNLF
jgi:hypothetical protein